ncbi:MAG: Omp28-related outer membrane protein [Flavobacteriales bacterium]|nr:Omp28-related outer membrane protein [Flavobacteriales bacterium]
MMNKFHLSLATALLIPLSFEAQTLVTTEPQGRTCLLEVFTAINCGNCPAAHTVANGLAADHPDDLVLVEVHGGSLSVPQGAQPDFRTDDGAALWSSWGVTFQPQGLVNRSQLSSANSWPSSVPVVLSASSPVNVGLASAYDAGSQQLSIMVEAYYTGTSLTSTDQLYVLLTEDHVVGYQQDYVNGAHAAYDHRHALRDYVTSVEGEDITMPAAGEFVQHSYTYTVPSTWSLEELHVVAFVQADQGPVYQVKRVAAMDGSTAINESSAGGGLGSAYPVPAAEQVFVPMAADHIGGVLTVTDVQGRTVLSFSVPAGSTLLTIPVADLADGVYAYGLAGADRRLMVVRH